MAGGVPDRKVWPPLSVLTNKTTLTKIMEIIALNSKALSQ